MTERMHRLIDRYLDATDFAASVTQTSEFLFDTLARSGAIAEEGRAEARASIRLAIEARGEELRQAAIETYAAHHTEQDMEAAVAWAESPAARRFAAARGVVMAESERRARAILIPAFDEIAGRLSAAGGA